MKNTSFSFFLVCRFSEKFWLGGSVPPVFGWGAKPPRPPPTEQPSRDSLAFDRGGQTGPPWSNALFFRLRWRHGRHRKTSDDRPPAVRRLSGDRQSEKKRQKLREFFYPYICSRSFRNWWDGSANPDDNRWFQMISCLIIRPPRMILQNKI